MLGEEVRAKTTHLNSLTGNDLLLCF